MTPSVPIAIPADHGPLLASADPALAANKRLVYDMYRVVLEAGLADRAHEFIAVDYIQHNPNAGQGLSGIISYVRATRPERPLKERLELPLVTIVAEGDRVMFALVRPEIDPAGQNYHTTWFDLFRIENGLIAEHWDPMLRTDAPVDPNDKKI